MLMLGRRVSTETGRGRERGRGRSVERTGRRMGGLRRYALWSTVLALAGSRFCLLVVLGFGDAFILVLCIAGKGSRFCVFRVVVANGKGREGK